MCTCRSPGNYSLFFHIRNTVQRFRIEKVGNKYIMGGRTFTSLTDVISRYKVEQIVEGYCLGDPVLKAPHQIFLKTHRLIRQNNTNINTLNNIATEITNNSEDVYATLRESRETAWKQKQTVLTNGYLYKKSKFRLHCICTCNQNSFQKRSKTQKMETIVLCVEYKRNATLLVRKRSTN